MHETHRPRCAARRLLAPLTLVLVGAVGCGQVQPTAEVDSSPGGQRFGTAQKFFSAPGLRPSAVTITRDSQKTDGGYVLAAPRPDRQARGGPMIFDNTGHLVWFHPLPKREQAIAFSVQRYHGKPVLTWGQRPVAAHAGAFFQVVDSSYRRIARVRAGRGDVTDLHDFEITPRNTALLLGYHIVPRNLSSVGGPAKGLVLDGTVQEVSIRTGRVLWRWSALAHIPVSSSLANVPSHEPYDAYHLNSVARAADGNLLVSARHTSTLYKISRKTGHVIWRLGGRHSSFKVSKAARFAFQHDARWGPGSTVTIFDNGATNTTKVLGQSSGKRLRIHARKRTVTLVRRVTHSPPISSESQGSYQPLADGHAFIGWGHDPLASEFGVHGELLWQVRFPSGRQQSYSAERHAWTGTPRTRPAVVGSRHGRQVRMQASWNGATEVARWEVLAGPNRQELRPVGDAKRRGFETVLRTKTSARWVAARALDAGGRPLGTSRALSPH